MYFDRSDTCRSSYLVYYRKFYVLSFINQKNVVPLRRKGAIAGNTRKEIEARLGHSVISSTKATDYLPEQEIKPIEE